MKTLWNEKASVHQLFKSYSFGIKKEWCLIEYEWKLQLAHVECLFDANILDENEYNQLKTVISTLATRYNLEKMPKAPALSTAFEDIHSFVEFKICEKAKEAGKKIHTARSRNDQIATLLKLYLGDCLKKLKSENNKIIEILIVKAGVYQGTPMPTTTHFQQAALGSVGHYLKMREKALSIIAGDIDSLIEKNMKECPLGSGACVGSSVAIDRNIQAKNLGFISASENSLYSVSCRDEILDYAHLCSKLSLHLLNFANELILWANQNFDWIKLPRDFCTGSSMMPNKLNPDFLELLRCDLKEFLVWPNKLLLQLSSLPSGYCRDLQIIKDDLFTMSPKISGLLLIFQHFLKEIEFKKDNLKESLNLGFIDATLEMERMVKSGTPLRAAHNSIAKRVQGEKNGSFCKGDFTKRLNAYNTIGSPGY